MLVRVELEAGLWGRDYQQAVERVGDRLLAVDAPRVLVGGEERAREEFQERAQEDLERGETLALPVMLVLLFLVFRGSWPPSRPCWWRSWPWPGPCSSSSG